MEANPELSKYSQSDEMIKAVILSGVDHVVKHVGFEKHRERMVKSAKAFQDENGNSTYTTPESVNHSKDAFPSPYFTYMKKTFSFERRKTLIRDSSIISPLTVFLFSQGHVFGYEQETRNESVGDDGIPILRKKMIIIKITDKENVSLICGEDLASLLFEFRDSIWSVVRYLIDNQGLHIVVQPKEVDVVEEYKKEMLKVLDQILTAAAKSMSDANIKEIDDKEVDYLSVRGKEDL